MKMRNFKKITLSTFLLCASGFVFGQTPNEDLLDWAQENNLEEVKKCIAKGADINYSEDTGENAIYFAIDEFEDDNFELINYLITKGADLTVKNEDSETLLHIAAYNESPALFKLIVDGGALINAKDGDGSTVLHVSADQGNVVGIKKLIELGANTALKDGDDEDYLEILEIDEIEILNKIIDLEFTQKQKNYLLYNSIDELEDSASVVTLLSKGADPSSIYDDESMLEAATFCDTYSILELLVNKGADVNRLNEDLENILYEVEEPSTIKLIVSKGVNLKNVNDNGLTVLHDAVKWGEVEKVKTLLELGADKKQKTELGTAMEYAQTINDLPNSRVKYATPELKQQHLDKYLEKIKKIKKLLK